MGTWWWQLLPPAEVRKSKSLACVDIRIDPGARIFCGRHRAQNPFVDPFLLRSRQDTQGHRNPRFKSMPPPSIKMAVRSETNPTAQSDKDPPQTHRPFTQVHPAARGSNQICVRRTWSHGASTPSSALIRRSTPCPNNPLALLHGLPQKVSVLMNKCFRIKTCFLGNSQLALSLQLEQTILINPQPGSLVTRSCQSGLSLV